MTGTPHAIYDAMPSFTSAAEPVDIPADIPAKRKRKTTASNTRPKRTKAARAGNNYFISAIPNPKIFSSARAENEMNTFSQKRSSALPPCEEISRLAEAYLPQLNLNVRETATTIKSAMAANPISGKRVLLNVLAPVLSQVCRDSSNETDLSAHVKFANVWAARVKQSATNSRNLPNNQVKSATSFSGSVSIENTPDFGGYPCQFWKKVFDSPGVEKNAIAPQMLHWQNMQSRGILQRPNGLPAGGQKAPTLPGVPGSIGTNVIDTRGGLDYRGMAADGNHGAGIKKLADRLKTGREVLTGGKADGKPDVSFSAKALRKGQKVEREHTNNPQLTKEIAKDYLTEQPDYYQRLERVEKGSGGVR